LMPYSPPSATAQTQAVITSTAPGTTMIITQRPQPQQATPAPVTTIHFTQTISTGTTVVTVTSQVTVPQVTFITSAPAPAAASFSGQQKGAPPVTTGTSQAFSIGLVPMPANAAATSAAPVFSGTSTFAPQAPVSSFTNSGPSASVATFTGAGEKINAQNVFGAIGGGLALVVLLI
jgi:hypothetical protein